MENRVMFMDNRISMYKMFIVFKVSFKCNVIKF